MNVDPNARARRAHEAASLLLEGGFYADAASRAYYAAFYIARDAIRQAGMKTHTHKGVHVSFQSVVCPDRKDLKGCRTHAPRSVSCAMDADYDDGEAIAKEQALEALDLARQFVKHIQKLLDG